MKVLVIGNDPKLFDEKSEAFERVRKYAGLFDELHIVNISFAPLCKTGLHKGLHNSCASSSCANQHCANEVCTSDPLRYGNLFLWPTNSKIAALGWLDAYHLGRKIIKERGIDIIDAQDPGESGLAAWLAARKIKVIFRIQIHTDIFSPWYRRAGWKERGRYWLAKFLIPRADCIRVVSERIRQSLMSNVKCPPSNISVLPIWTDVSKFSEARSGPATEARFNDYDFKIISVGRLVDKEKNFSMLIDTMRDFVEICPRALLVIVGDGPDGKRYRLQVANYKLESNVIIEKWRDDLPLFLKSFNLFVLPSNYEGWGRVVIEAMAAGLPIIMTDVGLAGEIVKNGENGVVVPVGDRKSMLKGLIEIYQNTVERRRLAKAGKESLENLYLRTEEEYLRLYRKSYLACGYEA